MFRAITRFWLVPVLLFLGGQAVFGFALGGPIGNAADSWQVPALGYGLAPINFDVDVVAPKNLGEEYRWNTKNVFYAYDASFLDYFGTNGAAQIDAAFAILNSLSNVDSYSPGLTEWPLTSSRINPTAADVDMYDLKSEALVSMVEQLGLAQPDRYTFAMHDRVPPLSGPVCPNYTYYVTERNFDPVAQNYSTYVNGVLYSYQIIETCALPALNPYAPIGGAAVSVPVDPEQYAEGDSAVAAGTLGGVGNPLTTTPFTELGRYYLNLTRDDVGGFRYLWSSNTINTESVEPESLLQLPPPQPTLITTSNLATLIAAEQTNSPAQLAALFPNIIISSSTFLYFSNVVTTSTISYYTNSPIGPANSPAILVYATVVTTNPIPIPIYSYTFGNVITNFIYTNGPVLITNQVSPVSVITTQQVVIVPNPYFQGYYTTNTNTSSSVEDVISGEYFVIPTNACGYTILSNVYASVVTVTNVVATNAVNTNGTGGTNVGVQSFSIVSYFTNHILAVSIPTCVTGSVGLREGMEKMNFFRVDYDSLVGQTWGPVTTTYSLTAITNSKPVVQTFYRNVTQPDILFSANDLVGGPAAIPVSFGSVRTAPTFNQANILPGLAGPGTITPTPIHIIFNKSGPIFESTTNSFLVATGTGGTNIPVFQWASFDGTTNAPVVYPTNNTYQGLVNNIFLQFSVPGSLPDGTVSVPYSFELQATGATPPPYTYATNSGALPAGLNLVSANGNTFIAGTPTTVGIYDFTLQVSDTTGRVSGRNFVLEIDP